MDDVNEPSNLFIFYCRYPTIFIYCRQGSEYSVRSQESTVQGSTKVPGDFVN
jgi:hypothetical protein